MSLMKKETKVRYCYMVSKKMILLLDHGSGHHFNELQTEGKILFRSEKIGQFRMLLDYVYKADHFTFVIKIL